MSTPPTRSGRGRRDRGGQARCGAGDAGSAAAAASALEQLLGDALDVGGVHLALVGLHDVADEPADLLGIGDAERLQALPDECLQRRVVEAPGEIPLAERDLEAELRGLGGAALTELVVLGE